MAGAFKCPKCRLTTWRGLKYCPNCGQVLMVTCSGCGFSWRYIYDYKYCPACGTKAVKEEKRIS